MSSRVPIVRQVSWISLVPFAGCLVFAIYLGYLIFPSGRGVPGLAIFYVWLLSVNRLIPRHHRAAIRLVKQKRFEEAIPEYQKSLAFFQRHAWIDRYRCIVLLSLSSISYREMELLGIAFCYGQIGDGARSTEIYRQCLEEFPESEMAASALRLLDSVREPSSSEE